MQTVNFNCDLCNKLMAVGLNLLGRNVRCPHCKQVVQAPASPSMVKIPRGTPRSPAKVPAKTGEAQESIFGEVQNDDLFGRAQSSAPEPPPVPDRRFSQPTAIENPNNAHLYAPTVDLPPPIAPASWQNNDRTEVTAHTLDDEPEVREYTPREPVVRESGGGGGIFVWMLLLYALIATGIAAWLFYERTENEGKQNAPAGAGDKNHPYYAIPDFFGQFDRADRKELSMADQMPKTDLELPKDLQAGLLGKIAIGDIEVTPLKVEYRLIKRYRKHTGRPPVPSPINPEIYLYVMTLAIKNTSDDLYFCPTDPAFARRRIEASKDSPPYNRIIFGKDRTVSGGAFLWPDSDYEYEFLEDQKNDEIPLAPGEERSYVIAGHMDIRDIKSALKDRPDDPIVWRVQLRRGLVEATDPDGVKREISASCVIGVNLENSDFPKTD